MAICAYLLAQEGRLDLDAPVTRYWPEFGQHGKAEIPVRWLLTHQSGLPALDKPFTREEVLAWEPVIKAIEAQTPLWKPGTAHSYHAITYGWLIGEVIRRITGEMPGAYFSRVLGEPLGLRTWIGLPATERDAVAWMLAPIGEPVPASDPVAERGITMGGAFAFPADEDGLVSFNDPAIQAAQIPGAGAVSTAESLARLYAACVSEVGGARLLSPASVDDAVTVRVSGQQVYGLPTRDTAGAPGSWCTRSPARCSAYAASATTAPAGTWPSATTPTRSASVTWSTRWAASTTSGPTCSPQRYGIPSATADRRGGPGEAARLSRGPPATGIDVRWADVACRR